MFSLLICLGRSEANALYLVNEDKDTVLGYFDKFPGSANWFGATDYYCIEPYLIRDSSTESFHIHCMASATVQPKYATESNLGALSEQLQTNITNIEGRILGDALMTNTKINNLLKPNAIPVKEYDEIKTISSIAITGLVFALLHFILHIIVMCIQRSGNNDSEPQADANYA
ncbi:MAG: hypothetical protein LBR40_00185 [Bacilli bacterium]|jgi:hypothetical protein|nr:hypothetical protein [Bacilli bacterium]